MGHKVQNFVMNLGNISKITKTTTVDFKMKNKTQTNIPKQHGYWLVFLKKIQHIFSDTESFSEITHQVFQK